MSSVQYLREFVRQRLTAAAEEIFGVLEKTIVEYEEEIDRQRRLLDIVWRPEVKLTRVGEQQDFLTEQQLRNQGRSSSLDPEEPEPEPPQVKEEQQELCTSREGEQLVLKQETDDVMLIPPHEESDHREAEPSSDQQLLSPSSPVAPSVDPSATTETSCNTLAEENALKCDTCGKTFRYKSKFQRHLRVHTGEKPYVCSTCGKRFRQTSQLKVHLRIHTGEKPYSCKTCGRAFRNSGDLKVHMRRAHTGEKPYMCNTCGQGFSETTSLRQHMIIHTGEKPYSCELCGKAFTRGRAMLVHMRSHTGEKPYSCEMCGKRFARSNGLLVHMRTHAAEKPCACNISRESFFEMSQLEAHRSPHTKLMYEEEVPADKQLRNQERSSSLDPEEPEPEPPQVKEEQEELCTSREGEQLVLKQETDDVMLIPPHEESDHREAEPSSDQQLLSPSSPVAESQDPEGSEQIDSRSTGRSDKRHQKNASRSDNVDNCPQPRSEK